MSYHYIPIKMAKFIMNDLTRDMSHCWWESKMVQTLWEIVWQYLQKLKRH